MQKYCNLVDSKRREPANRKENYQDEPLIMKSYTVVFEEPVKNTTNQADIKSRHSGKYNDPGVGLSIKSVATCHKCDRRVHIQGYFKSNGNGSDGY